jgi:hypothetical protein
MSVVVRPVAGHALIFPVERSPYKLSTYGKVNTSQAYV